MFVNMFLDLIYLPPPAPFHFLFPYLINIRGFKSFPSYAWETSVVT